MATFIAPVSTTTNYNVSKISGCGVRAEPDEEAEQNFIDWLRSNGAKFGGIQWPSHETESGMRGAVARRDIATGVRRRYYIAINCTTAVCTSLYPQGSRSDYLLNIFVLPKNIEIHLISQQPPQVHYIH